MDDSYIQLKREPQQICTTCTSNFPLKFALVQHSGKFKTYTFVFYLKFPCHREDEWKSSESTVYNISAHILQINWSENKMLQNLYKYCFSLTSVSVILEVHVVFYT